MFDFKKFDKTVNYTELEKETNEAKEKQKMFGILPEGEYVCRLRYIGALPNPERKHKGEIEPGTYAEFEVVEGQYMKRLIFFSSSHKTGFLVHKANTLVNGLQVAEEDVNFCKLGFEKWNRLLEDFAEENEREPWDYKVTIKHSKSGDKTFQNIDAVEPC